MAGGGYATDLDLNLHAAAVSRSISAAGSKAGVQEYDQAHRSLEIIGRVLAYQDYIFGGHGGVVPIDDEIAAAFGDVIEAVA